MVGQLLQTQNFSITSVFCYWNYHVTSEILSISKYVIFSSPFQSIDDTVRIYAIDYVKWYLSLSLDVRALYFCSICARIMRSICLKVPRCLSDICFVTLVIRFPMIFLHISPFVIDMYLGFLPCGMSLQTVHLDNYTVLKPFSLHA